MSPSRSGKFLASAGSGAWLAVRLIKRYTSRENLYAGVRTASWLVPLTLLIWIYAEREQVVKDFPEQSIPIHVTTNDPNRYVQLMMSDSNVIAKLTGPLARLNELRSRLAMRGPDDTLNAVDLSVDQSLSPGTIHDLDPVQMLSASPLFAHSGVTITSCKPDHLRVYVDVYDETEVEVRPPPSATNLVGTPSFEPRRVKIRAPRKAIERAAGSLYAQADLASTGMMDKPGTHDADKVRLSVPELNGENVSVTPPSVKATFEVRPLDATYTLPSVRIEISSPQYLQTDWIVNCPSNIYDVKLVGPPDKLAELKLEDAPKPWAVLQVNSEDRPAGGTGAAPSQKNRRLRIEGLPEGVHVDPSDVQRLSVDFSLVERAPAER